jgi:hypothetical protein
MEWLFVALVVVLAVIWWWKGSRWRNGEPNVHFTVNNVVMDKYTRQYREQLIKALGESFDVFPKVTLAEIVDYEVGDDKASQRYADELDAACVDLLVLDKPSGELRCIVMLSRQVKPGSRQLLIRQVCQQSKLPFLLLDVHNALSDKEIRQKIMAMSEPTIVTDGRDSDDVKVYLEPGHRR